MALPLTYSDGTRIDYARSASTSADWTYWNTIDQTAFGELAWKPGGDWAVRGVVTYRRFEESARLLYAFGLPNRTTGRGMQGQTGRYDSNYDQLLFDGYASGSVSLFGRDHQLAFGVSNGRSDGEQYAGNGLALVDYGDVRDLANFRAPQIGYTPMAQRADTRDLLTRAYGAMHLNLTDRLKSVVGATAIWLKSSGLSYDVDQSRKNSRVSPYVIHVDLFTVIPVRIGHGGCEYVAIPQPDGFQPLGGLFDQLVPVVPGVARPAIAEPVGFHAVPEGEVLRLHLAHRAGIQGFAAGRLQIIIGVVAGRILGQGMLIGLLLDRRDVIVRQRRQAETAAASIGHFERGDSAALSQTRTTSPDEPSLEGGAIGGSRGPMGFGRCVGR